MATLKGRHRQNRMWSCGWSRAGSETTPEEKQIIHDVLFREIVNPKSFCLTWGAMGSEVCRRHAEAMGWHGKEWGSTHGIFSMTEADREAFREKRRQRAKEYAAAHRERLKREREAME